MPLTPTLRPPAQLDASTHNNSELDAAPGAPSSAVAVRSGVLLPQCSHTSLRSSRTPESTVELESDARAMGGAVGGLNGLGSHTMTLSVNERGERAAMRGSAGTLQLPVMPHVLSRAYTAPVLPSPASPIVRTSADVNAGNASRTIVGLAGSELSSGIERASTTTPAPTFSGPMRSNAHDLSPSPVIVVSPTHACGIGPGRPANTTAGVVAANSSAPGAVLGGLVEFEDTPLGLNGTYTLPGYHFLAATVGTDMAQSAGRIGSDSGSPETLPFAAGTSLPDLLPAGSGSNADGISNQGCTREDRSGPEPEDAGWATIPPPANPAYEQSPNTARDMHFRRGGRMLSVEGWAPSPPLPSVEGFPFAESNMLVLPPHLQTQTLGAGPGPSTVHIAYVQELKRQHGYGFGHSKSLSDSHTGSGSPSSVSSGTPPRINHDTDPPRFISDLQASYMSSNTDNGSTATAYKAPYSNAYEVSPFAMTAGPYSHPQSISPFATASTLPEIRRNTHTNTVGATVPGTDANTRMHFSKRSMAMI